MRQADLNRAVARATGESVATIKRLGFLLADPVVDLDESDIDALGPTVIDWDALQSQRYIGNYGGSRREPTMS
ncbi:MAG: hypothetical protein MI757_05345 [Pirellulales bacterium]|nr:hypothetical protein [Pirellulales bacterium]